ncbi:MAG TPA: glycosyltransferase family 1 protein [Candidatus Sulfotelmatobacter sp.]|nr:glycosyltransferase family 1 protein [Candidatus Sulfotelmatobacter sp.]
MIHLFINALAASAGGGLTYVRNVVPHLAELERVRTTVLVNQRLRSEFRDSARVTLLSIESPADAFSRFWIEQKQVPGLIRHSGANVLLSAGNFALWNSPVPQILLSRNSLYTSPTFGSDLRTRGEYRIWIETQIKGAFAKWSIQIADAAVAPSEAFAGELRGWTGKPVLAIHHGFDREAFVQDQSPLAAETQKDLNSTSGALRLLFVSHYNYYRNFETLIRAIPVIRRMIAPRKIRLFLTCNLVPGLVVGGYRTDSVAALVRELEVRDEIIELGAVPYNSLHHVYRAADIYVSPAYAESFAHPLVEAMSSGLPVTASDLPVHREICGDAALYFDRFAPARLAESVVQISKSSQLAQKMSQAGRQRAQAFSWSVHVDHIVELASRLIAHG